MRLYVDGLAVYYSVTNEINQFIWMPRGEHTIEVTAEGCGFIASATVPVNVVSQEPGISNI